MSQEKIKKDVGYNKTKQKWKWKAAKEKAKNVINKPIKKREKENKNEHRKFKKKNQFTKGTVEKSWNIFYQANYAATTVVKRETKEKSKFLLKRQSLSGIHTIIQP